MTVLADWTARHDMFDRALQALRRVAPEGDRKRTLAALAKLNGPLALHMAQEERVLLPPYTPLAEALPPNGAPRVLLADHARLRELVGQIQEHAGAARVGGVLAEQEALSLLAGVLEHHDLRERTWFIPTLDREAPLEERQAWVAAFEEEEASLPPFEEPRLQRGGRPAPSSPNPLVAFKLAIARDADVATAFASVPTPAHPKAQRLMDRVQGLLDALRRTNNVAARRDCLAALSDVARLLGIVANAR